jgi:hypothetical protein
MLADVEAREASVSAELDDAEEAAKTAEAAKLERFNQSTRECPDCQELQRQVDTGERTVADIVDTHLLYCLKHVAQLQHGCSWDPDTVGIARGMAQAAGVCVFVNEHGAPDCACDWLALEKVATGNADLYEDGGGLLYARQLLTVEEAQRIAGSEAGKLEIALAHMTPAERVEYVNAQCDPNDSKELDLFLERAEKRLKRRPPVD